MDLMRKGKDDKTTEANTKKLTESCNNRIAADRLISLSGPV